MQLKVELFLAQVQYNEIKDLYRYFIPDLEFVHASSTSEAIYFKVTRSFDGMHRA
jgi:hypothetical protein